jgi:hypothetical protein
MSQGHCRTMTPEEKREHRRARDRANYAHRMANPQQRTRYSVKQALYYQAKKKRLKLASSGCSPEPGQT